MSIGSARYSLFCCVWLDLLKDRSEAMPTSATIFDSSIDRWIAEGQTPWGKLRDKVTLANLRRHIGPGPLNILDAGGGNGRDSIPLAAEGHRVTIVDYSAEMLADAARNATAAQAHERVALHQAE